MKLPNALTKKIGPLPTGIWVLVIVGGYFAAKYIRAHRAAAASSATDANANVADNSGSPAMDSGTGVGGSAGGGYGIVQPVAGPVQGGQPVPAQTADYTALLSTAIDSLGNRNDPLIDPLNTAVGGLSDSLQATVGSLTDTNRSLIDRFHMPVAVTVKVPTDKSGARTAAPHHGLAIVTPPKGLKKSAAPAPSHKQSTASEKPHPQTQGPESVRSQPHTVAHGQGSKPAGHSVAIHGGGGGHMLEA